MKTDSKPDAPCFGGRRCPPTGDAWPRRASLLLAVAFAAWTAVFVCSCSRPPAPPLSLHAPWEDGAVSNYDVLDANGKTVGTGVFSWRKEGEHWKHDFALDIRGKKDTGEVETDAELHPVRTTREKAGTKVAVEYGEHEVVVRTTDSDGKTTEKTMPRPAFAIDNDQSLETQRALPLADGYSVEYDNVVARSLSTVRLRLAVKGSETITVPAGQFDTWHVSMAAAGKPHDAWYAKSPPHLLVKYHNTGSGTVFVLRSWKVSTDAPLQGDTSPPVVAQTGPVGLNWGFLAAALVFAFPLMIGLPIALGVLFSRKLGVSGKLWGLGALSFVSSQVVHLPLNWAVGLLGATPRGLGTLPMPWLAIVAGLSAGLCEELARYVFLRFVARKSRHTWAEALQFGAGHGGIEAIIVGALFGLSVIAMIVLLFVPSSVLGIPASSAGDVATAVDAFWGQPWHMPLVSGLERVSAVTAHIGMTVLVMRAVARRNPLYLVAAIAAHTGLDAFAVWSAYNLGTTWTEVGVGVLAAGLLALTIALREPVTASPPVAA